MAPGRTSGTDAPHGLALLTLLGLGLVVARRRRTGAVAVALGALGAALLLSGCEVDPYCFDCERPGDAGTDGHVDVPDGCIPRGDELCNGQDDDCDGLIDEDWDLDRDPANCGACGALCVVPNAIAACADGDCTVDHCDVGWVDGNDNSVDGCEYECLVRGDEICNDRDDDCDGLVDEDFTLDTDVANCGVCGNVCAFGHGDATCVDGECALTGCDPGFVDDNLDPLDGCEYGCAEDGPEDCDGRDNDCDGDVDEGFDLTSDVENCGACGRLCEFANATAACVDSRCTVADCDDGFLDQNLLPSDGCEYPCEDPNAQEVCDGIDNDCDGLEDEDDPALGTPCGNDLGECTPGTWVCRVGTLACVGVSQLQAEQCDGLDNNCDGVVDDGNPGGGGRCGTNVGECEFGVETCQNGAITCVGGTGPAGAELCNGLDDDCNGATDEGNPGGGGACGTDVGQCELGVEQCRAGRIECTGGIHGIPELCNGLDDDCDGVVDNGNPGGGGRCGTNVGDCEFGTQQCQGGGLVCVGGTGPAVETCNNEDDNCNGAIDDGNPGGGGACGTDEGQCTFGVSQCIAGAQVCQGGIRPIAELCNGLDDDCDGVVDDGNPGGGGRCGTNAGNCEFGALECQGGAFVCVGGITPVAETCNGQDENCNGAVDDGNPGGGAVCGTDVGVCDFGTTLCSGGALTCLGDVPPGLETCNGLDDDCDGVVDDGNPGGGGRCGTNTGACEFGALQCQGGALACVGGIGPSPETCNGQDDNCNGATDEGNPGGGAQCGTDVGQCSFGTTLCQGGALGCAGGIGPVLEACNNLDDDCDGAIDDGNPGGGGRCGTNVGACEFGAITCQAGAFVCTGGTGPVAETCNGVDDDCNGGIDEGVTPPNICDPDGVCAGTVAACAGAQGWRCTYPAPPYQPVELWCDTRDNDCDGVTDPGCPSLSVTDRRVDLGGAAANSIQPALTGDGVDRVFTAWLDRRNARADIYYNRAAAPLFDGWQNPAVAVESNNANSVGPAVAFGDARLYFAWEDFRDNAARRNVYFRRTTANGLGDTMAAAEFRINTGLNNDSFNVQMVADGAQGVFVVWETQLADRSRRVYVASSRNQGGAFDAPFRVDTSGVAVPVGTTPSIAVGGAGQAYVVWRDTRSGQPDIRFNRTLDGGVTWLGADVRLDTDLAGLNGSIQPQVAADAAGNVVVAWADERNGVWDIYAQRSTNHGDTWLLNDVRVDTDVFAHDSLRPRVAMEAGHAWVVWEDYRDGLPDIRMSESDDAGATWLTEDQRADTDPLGVGGSTDPVVAVDGGVVYVAWLDDRDGQRDIYLNFALDGLTLQPADLRVDTGVAGAADSVGVTLYAANGRAHAVWVDYRAGNNQSGDIYHRYLE